MLKEKNGRVTFMPLNRLKPKNPPHPNAQDAIPLMDKLRYDATHEKAIQQVFSKTCVCRDLTIAAAYVKSHGINTITLDGDKVDRKGALTGGYHDVRRSRIDAIKNVTIWRSKYEAEQKRSKEVKVAILRVDQQITHITGKITVLTNQQNQRKDARERLMGEAETWMREKERLKDRLAKLEKDAEDLESELNGLRARGAGYQAELASPLMQGLTREEVESIDNLGKEVDQRRTDLIALSRTKHDVRVRQIPACLSSHFSRAQLESRKNLIEIELNESLRRQRRELQNRIDKLSDENRDSSPTGNLEGRTRDLKALNMSIDSLTKKAQGEVNAKSPSGTAAHNRHQVMEKETEQLTAQLHELQTLLENVQNQQSEDSRSVSKQQKMTERYLAKRQMLLSRKEECNRNIRDLGVLPEEAFEKYTNEKLDRVC
jgi:structural maintenance of chromosome 3 (chondroitin sulfate proteoglycan 6)